MLHTRQSPSPRQRDDGWVLFVTQTSTSVQKLHLVIKACICGRAEAEGFIHLPRRRQPVQSAEAHGFVGFTNMPVPRTAPAPEPQASLKSATALARSILPGGWLPAHQATRSLREKATSFVKQKSCRETAAFSSSLLVLPYE